MVSVLPCACVVLIAAGGTERPETYAGPLRELRGAVCTQDLLQVGFVCRVFVSCVSLAWLGVSCTVLPRPVPSRPALCFIFQSHQQCVLRCFRHGQSDLLVLVGCYLYTRYSFLFSVICFRVFMLCSGIPDKAFYALDFRSFSSLLTVFFSPSISLIFDRFVPFTFSYGLNILCLEIG